MEEIIKLCKSYLASCAVLLILILLFAGTRHYINKPPLFIPPLESERKTLEEAISSSNDLEVIKKTCKSFAKCQDNFSIYQQNFTDHLNDMLIGYMMAFVILLGSFAYGFYKILLTAKRSKQ